MTTLIAQPRSLQASIIDALTGDEPEQALEQAFLQLSRGGELPLLMAMLKGLVRAGLAGLAVRLLHSASGPLAAEPQLAELACQLERLPDGAVDHEALASAFKANCAALLPSRPHLRPVLDGMDFAEDFVAYRSRKGNFQLIREGSSRRLDFVFPFADHIGQAAAMKLPDVTLSTAFILLGVPTPALWRRLLEQRTASGYVPPIDIIEPEAQVLALWLHLIEETDALGDERVAIFAGTDAVEQYRQFLIDHSWRTPSAQCLTSFRPRWQPPAIDRRFFDSVAAARDERKRQAFGAIEHRCANKDAAFWRRRFQSAGRTEPPLRVMGFTTRYSTVIQHSMRDLASAFTRCGCAFEIIKQPNSYCASVDVVGSLSKPAECDAVDLIVVIDHLRSEYAGAIPAKIPYVCWIQDHMDSLCRKDAGRSVGELDLVVGHAPGLLSSLYDYPLDRFLPTSNLTDPFTYSDDALPPGDLERYRCDVSYVGHGWQTAEDLIPAMAGHDRRLAKYLGWFVEMSSQRLKTSPWLTIGDRLRMMMQAEAESGSAPLPPALRARVIYPAIERLYDRLFRHEALEWAARWATRRRRRFRVFGEGWHRHPRFAEFACGPVENGHELRCVYQASAISLQANGYQSLHQRLLDGIASGGCVLSRFNPADFHCVHLRRVQRIIRERRFGDLAALLRAARHDRELGDALDQAERMSGLCVAPATSARRREEIELIRNWGFWPQSTLDDAGLFESLESLTLHAHRVAGDIDGFEHATFETEAELHQRFDHLIGDEGARRSLMRAPRRSILGHDTYDGLVERIIAAFSGQPATSSS